jgi:hypothetical protein
MMMIIIIFSFFLFGFLKLARPQAKIDTPNDKRSGRSSFLLF